MTIEELNKLIKEELDAYMGEEAEDEVVVTTDEEDIEGGADELKDALSKIRELINDLLPETEPEAEAEEEEEEEGEEKEEEGEEEGDDEGEENEEEEVEENLDRPNYKASDMANVTHDTEKIKGGLNESFDGLERFKKLANIKG